MARYKRMTGHNVLHPIGWDAFGLPAEQYAIQTGTHPAITTARNVARFRQQLQALGVTTWGHFSTWFCSNCLRMWRCVWTGLGNYQCVGQEVFGGPATSNNLLCVGILKASPCVPGCLLVLPQSSFPIHLLSSGPCVKIWSNCLEVQAFRHGW